MTLQAVSPTPVARDITQVNRALRQLEQAVDAGEQAVRIPARAGFLGIGRDKAAEQARRALLAPAAQATTEAVQLLRANGGYGTAYGAPHVSWGDNGEPIDSIMAKAAEHPIRYRWPNDFPWQDQPVTDLATMVSTVTDMAGRITRAEANLNVDKAVEITGGALYERRVQDLPLQAQQALHDAIAGVQQVRSSRFVDDRLRARLDTLPAEVLRDGRLTADPASLERLEGLHRATVVDRGTARASESVANQLARAGELAASGDTAAAREIYERLGRE